MWPYGRSSEVRDNTVVNLPYPHPTGVVTRYPPDRCRTLTSSLFVGVDYRDVCDKLDRAAVPDASQADPSLAAWVDLKDAVFTISKPTALKKPTRTTIRRQLKPLPELKPEGVPAPRRGEEGEGEMPADEGKKDEEEWETCWIVQPDTNRALYRFLLSLHLRGRGEQRGHAGLIPPGLLREILG